MSPDKREIKSLPNIPEQRYLLLHDASIHLCSSLMFEKSLTNFLHFIQPYIPIDKIVIGNLPLLSNNNINMPIVYNNIMFANTQYVYAEPSLEEKIQKILSKARKVGYYFGGKEDDLLAETFNSIINMNIFSTPFLWLPIVIEENFLSSLTFTFKENQTISEEQKDFLIQLQLPLQVAITNCVSYFRLNQMNHFMSQENQTLRQKSLGLDDNNIIGATGGLKKTIEKVQIVAPLDVCVLVTGETGTGKDVIARAIHTLSKRKKNEFVAVNCGALPPSLIDSELFGYEKGSFTGANREHTGKFERANNGTLFLDEIAELPLDQQTRLLRVLETKKIERIGGNKEISLDFRLITATNKNLYDMVKKGTFREDLFYRLKVVEIQIPPLRERPQDIPLFINYFTKKIASKYGLVPIPLASDVVKSLVNYNWPGNVRELQNMLEEAIILSPNSGVTFSPAKLAKKEEIPSLDNILNEYFQFLLKTTQGRIKGEGGAAEIAGLNSSTFRSKLKKLGILNTN